MAASYGTFQPPQQRSSSCLERIKALGLIQGGTAVLIVGAIMANGGNPFCEDNPHTLRGVLTLVGGAVLQGVSINAMKKGCSAVKKCMAIAGSVIGGIGIQVGSILTSGAIPGCINPGQSILHPFATLEGSIGSLMLTAGIGVQSYGFLKISTLG